jgi:DNA-directed RNA polymerase subunit E"
MSEQACRTCRRLLKGNLCPICKSTDVSRSWKGLIVIFDAESEIAKAAGLSSPGRYAVRVK